MNGLNLRGCLEILTCLGIEDSGRLGFSRDDLPVAHATRDDRETIAVFGPAFLKGNCRHVLDVVEWVFFSARLE